MNELEILKPFLLLVKNSIKMVKFANFLMNKTPLKIKNFVFIAFLPCVYQNRLKIKAILRKNHLAPSNFKKKKEI